MSNKMQNVLDDDEQFLGVCAGLDPTGSGLIQIQSFIDMVAESEQDMMMDEMHRDIES